MQATNVISFNDARAFELHDEAMSVAKDIKTHYLKLFEILIVIERRQIYYEFDVPSLYVYCVELLQLSKSVAKDFITVARKSLVVPELAEAIRSGKLTIPKARKICSVIDESNHEDWIGLAIECSCRIVEKAVAMANPKEAVPETLKYVSGEILEFKTGVDEEWTKLLERTKDLASQKSKRTLSSSEAIFAAMAEYCQRNDPLEKARRAEERDRRRAKDPESKATTGAQLEASAEREPNPEGRIGNSRANFRHRPASSEHAANLRDQCQCTFIYKNGDRCNERRWLNKHHIQEFSQGGDHAPENLETLCWGHHKIRHLKGEKKA